MKEDDDEEQLELALRRVQMNKNALRNPEQQMLDEIEASTARTYQMSLRLHDEVTHQNKYVEMMEDRYADTKGSLKTETKNINETRKAGQGLCWMYGVIAVEVVVFFVLLYVGLSH